MRIAIALLAGLALSAKAAIPVYLSLDGVTGGVNVAGREGNIEVHNLNHRVYLPTATDGSISGTRKHNYFVFHKETDISSVELERRMLQNVAIPSATFSFYEITDQGEEKRFYTVVLKNVRIVKVRKFLQGNVKQKESELASWSEEVSLVYDRITWTYLDGTLMHADEWNIR